MVGVITSRDVLLHPFATVRCFGWGIFFRAVFPWHDKPFLSLLQEGGFFQDTTPKLSALLGRCIELELRAKRIYTALAKTLIEKRSVTQFFEILARQEQDHADLLEVCRTAASRGGWKTNLFHPLQEFVPRLERRMDEVEASAYPVGCLDDALRMVIQIEASEVNQVFQAVLAASDSAFVKRLKPFRDATQTHMAYICQRIPEFAPHLLPACRELSAKYPRVK